MEGNEPIKIVKKGTPVPVFREKKETQIEVGETSFSKEQDNAKNYNGELGEKTFSLVNADNQETIANIQYDYPKDISNNLMKVRFVGMEEKYRGQGLSLKLYEHLFKLAKDKNLEGIESDSAVQAGAMAVWKKLMDKGYKVDINPAIEEKWQHFLEAYDERKFFRDMFSVPKNESVFKILFSEQS